MTTPTPPHPPSETARDEDVHRIKLRHTFHCPCAIEVVAKIKALPFGSCDGSRHLDRDDALEILKEWGER